MNQLDKIEVFISFLDLLKNPKQYDEMLAEMRERSKELKGVVDAYTSVENANKYFSKKESELAEKMGKFNQRVSDFDARMAKEEKDLEKRELETAKRAEGIDARWNELRLKEKELTGKDLRLSNLLEENERNKMALARQMDDYNSKDRLLKDKEAKLKQLLG